VKRIILRFIIPVGRGMQDFIPTFWIPAFAGMTEEKTGMIEERPGMTEEIPGMANIFRHGGGSYTSPSSP
jgi:hypothetical protein